MQLCLLWWKTLRYTNFQAGHFTYACGENSLLRQIITRNCIPVFLKDPILCSLWRHHFVIEVQSPVRKNIALFSYSPQQSTRKCTELHFQPQLHRHCI